MEPYCDSYFTCHAVLASLALQMVLLGYHAMFLNLVISLRDRIAMLKLTLVPLHRETTIYKKVWTYKIIHQGLPWQKPLQWPILFRVKYQITVEECLFTRPRPFLSQWCKQRVLDHLWKGKFDKFSLLTFFFVIKFTYSWCGKVSFN